MPPKNAGSSPRGWGTRDFSGKGGIAKRFIPTWVGNTRNAKVPRHCKTVHPHVGGEHGRNVAGIVLAYGSSPRGWGTQLPGFFQSLYSRFIPTWVGNTSRHG